MDSGAPRLIAGVDCSTQSTKVVIVDPEDGSLVATARAPHVVDQRGLASESDPEGWWAALGQVLRETGRADDVAAISIGAQQLSLVALDASGQVLRPAMLWNDTRSHAEIAGVHEAAGGVDAYVELTGSRLRPGMTLASWSWLRRNEPDVAARTTAIRLPHDFLTERLTGAAVTDRGDASATGWWDLVGDGYATTVLEAAGVDPAMLPRPLGPDSVAGEVTEAAARHTGLRPGTLVGCGTGDNMAAALALGIAPGEPVISLGTSGTVYTRSAARVPDRSARLSQQAAASGDQLPLGCVLNATLATDRFAALLGLARDAVAERTEVVAMPYFDGERLPDLPAASGTITGIRTDTSAEEILLAVHEGVIFSLLDGLDALRLIAPEYSATEPILLVGGGARGRVWQDTLRRLSGRAVHLPELDEHVAWGAAAQACAAAEGGSSVDVARRWGLRRGVTLPALDRDDAAVERITRVREAADALNRLV